MNELEKKYVEENETIDKNNQADTSVPSEGDRPTTGLLDGTDVSELEMSKDFVNVNIPYKGKIWRFKFRNITYHEKMVYSAQIYKAGKMGEQKLELAKLCERIFTDTVRGVPQGFMYRKMNVEFGKLLHMRIPGMTAVGTFEDIDEEDRKN